MWIKTSDRLPEEFVTVLFYIPDAHYALQGYRVGNKWVAYQWCEKYTGVTHWMPGPELPTE